MSVVFFFLFQEIEHVQTIPKYVVVFAERLLYSAPMCFILQERAIKEARKMKQREAMKADMRDSGDSEQSASNHHGLTTEHQKVSQ